MRFQIFCIDMVQPNGIVVTKIFETAGERSGWVDEASTHAITGTVFHFYDRTITKPNRV